MKNKIIILLGLAILVVVVAYLYFSSPGEVVVDEKGETVGMINKVRETLQGKEFWREQLREVDREIYNHISEPQRRAESSRDLDRALRQANQEMEEMYKKMPEARPSPAERQAEALRELADRIETAEVYRVLEVFQLERIEKLRNIRPLVQAKTN